ncbi:hypothetical protein RCCWILLIS_83 [Rhodobacter phage RcCWillis]|nr:hypothetical protein RCCWILLIS_83 [Rhodobacter phage RcCWillis]
MTMLFTSIKELAESGYVFRITDNGGETLDRITVLFCDGDYLALSETGAGISMWGGSDGRSDPVGAMQERVEDGTEIDLSLGDLTPALQAHILYRVNEAWRDALAGIEARDPAHVARSREAAQVNDGTHTCGGIGIYSAGEAYCIRLDTAWNDAADDRGPFKTAAEALRATLPDDYGLAGPEFHSSVDVNSLKRSPSITRRRNKLMRRLEREAA